MRFSSNEYCSLILSPWMISGTAQLENQPRGTYKSLASWRSVCCLHTPARDIRRDTGRRGPTEMGDNRPLSCPCRGS